VLTDALPSLPAPERGIVVKANAVNADLVNDAPQQAALRVFPELHVHAVPATAISLASLTTSAYAVTELPNLLRPAHVMPQQPAFQVPTAAEALEPALLTADAHVPFVSAVPKAQAMLQTLHSVHRSAWRSDHLVVHHFLSYHPELVFDMLAPAPAASGTAQSGSVAPAGSRVASVGHEAAAPALKLWKLPSLSDASVPAAVQPGSSAARTTLRPAVAPRVNSFRKEGMPSRPESSAPAARPSGSAEKEQERQLCKVAPLTITIGAGAQPDAGVAQATAATRSRRGSQSDDKVGSGAVMRRSAELLATMSSAAAARAHASHADAGSGRAAQQGTVSVLTLDAQPEGGNAAAAGTNMEVPQQSSQASKLATDAAEEQPGNSAAHMPTQMLQPNMAELPAPQPPSAPDSPHATAGMLKGSRMPRFGSLPAACTDKSAAAPLGIRPSRALLDYLWKRSGTPLVSRGMPRSLQTIDQKRLANGTGELVAANTGSMHAAAGNRLSASLPSKVFTRLASLRGIPEQLSSCVASYPPSKASAGVPNVDTSVAAMLHDLGDRSCSAADVESVSQAIALLKSAYSGESAGPTTEGQGTRAPAAVSTGHKTRRAHSLGVFRQQDHCRCVAVTNAARCVGCGGIARNLTSNGAMLQSNSMLCCDDMMIQIASPFIAVDFDTSRHLGNYPFASKAS
jgi:hypothetical protein